MRAHRGKLRARRRARQLGYARARRRALADDVEIASQGRKHRININDPIGFYSFCETQLKLQSRHRWGSADITGLMVAIASSARNGGGAVRYIPVKCKSPGQDVFVYVAKPTWFGLSTDERLKGV